MSISHKMSRGVVRARRGSAGKSFLFSFNLEWALSGRSPRLLVQRDLDKEVLPD